MCAVPATHLKSASKTFVAPFGFVANNTNVANHALKLTKNDSTNNHAHPKHATRNANGSLPLAIDAIVSNRSAIVSKTTTEYVLIRGIASSSSFSLVSRRRVALRRARNEALINAAHAANAI